MQAFELYDVHDTKVGEGVAFDNREDSSTNPYAYHPFVIRWMPSCYRRNKGVVMVYRQDFDQLVAANGLHARMLEVAGL